MAMDQDHDLRVGPDGLARPLWASRHEDLREYYDSEWGMPVRDERGVFERLALEGFQSGLSWAMILRPQALREANCLFTWTHRRVPTVPATPSAAVQPPTGTLEP